MSRPSRSALQRLGLGALSIGIVVATFAFVLPTIADYRDVWALTALALNVVVLYALTVRWSESKEELVPVR